MPVALITGSAGRIGSEICRHFLRGGFDVVGIDHEPRAWLFRPEASTLRTREYLAHYRHAAIHTRDVNPIADNNGYISDMPHFQFHYPSAVDATAFAKC